jgi:hypothetical protein
MCTNKIYLSIDLKCCLNENNEVGLFISREIWYCLGFQQGDKLSYDRSAEGNYVWTDKR